MNKIKKSLLVFAIVFVSFLSFNTKVNALVVSIDDVEPNTYVIGNSMFSRTPNQAYDGVLTTQHIMLAAKTIQGTNIADMVIYYKNARGAWVNAINNEEVVPPSTFSIRNIDMEELPYVPAPSVSAYLTIHEGALVAEFGAGRNDEAIIECHDENEVEVCTTRYENVDLFEVGNDNPIGTIPLGGAIVVTGIPVDGTTKQYYGKAYIMDGENKVYGEPGAIITLGHSIPTPTLTVTPTVSNNALAYSFGLTVTDPEYLPSPDPGAPHGYIGYAGVDVFNNNDNSLVGTITISSSNEVEPYVGTEFVKGEINEYYGKAFVMVNNEKVYGSKSTNVEIDLNVPNVAIETGLNGTGYVCEGETCSLEIGLSNLNALVAASSNGDNYYIFDGFDVFEVGSDEPVATSTVDGAANITNIPIESIKNYYAKGYSMVGETKNYGTSSNTIEVVFTKEIKLTNVLVSSSGSQTIYNFGIDLEDNPYATNFSGYEVYVLNNGQYVLDSSYSIENTATFSSTANDEQLMIRVFTTTAGVQTYMNAKLYINIDQYNGGNTGGGGLIDIPTGG